MARYLVAALASLSVFLLVACEMDAPSLVGTWQAVSITENGDSLLLNPSEIGFTFGDNQRYTYRSTINYREAGTYKLENGYLYAQDTTGNGAKQYVVAVDLLRSDSLLLRMRADTAERLVLLLRN